MKSNQFFTAKEYATANYFQFVFQNQFADIPSQIVNSYSEIQKQKTYDIIHVKIFIKSLVDEYF